MTRISPHPQNLKALKTTAVLLFSTLLVLCVSSPSGAQPPTENPKCMPPHWFVGMSPDTLSLLLYAKDIGRQSFAIDDPTGMIEIAELRTLPNPNYLILHLSIHPDARPTTVTFTSTSGGHPFEYQFKPRQSKPQGLDGSDIIYLITPDRFANGDTANDSLPGFLEPGTDRSDPYGRHGGDIRGMADRVSYLAELGVTAVWPNPLLENNQPSESYHGYAITDHYRIDPRFGSNAQFAAWVDTLHGREMKIVMDVIYNHIGDQHFIYTDLPDSSWFHFWDDYTKTSYQATTLLDPYASEYDRKIMSNGWFDNHMPDLNQTDPHLAEYLIQNTLWWIEEFGIDALRIDTYAYPDQDFMRNWAHRVKQVFPEIFLFAETWVHSPTVQRWFLGGLSGPGDNALDGLTDFQTHYAIQEALAPEGRENNSIYELYRTLASDYIYDHPERLVTFLDNHDVGRFYGVMGEDYRRLRLGLGILLTMRGIPSIYYGTEILMSDTDGHGRIRRDFPGGWPGDPIDKFRRDGRTAEENRAFDFIARLTRLRRTSPALHAGHTVQFVPQNGVYIYFRYTDDQKIMVAVNTSEEAQTVTLDRFSEMLQGQTTVANLLEDRTEKWSDTLELSPMDLGIWEIPIR